MLECVYHTVGWHRCCDTRCRRSGKCVWREVREREILNKPCLDCAVIFRMTIFIRKSFHYSDLKEAMSEFSKPWQMEVFLVRNRSKQILVYTFNLVLCSSLPGYSCLGKTSEMISKQFKQKKMLALLAWPPSVNYPPFQHLALVQTEVCFRNFSGRKSGKGFYVYPDGKGKKTVGSVCLGQL